MKKIILLPTFFFLLTLFPFAVFAQDSPSSPSTNSGSNNCWTEFNGAMNKCLREVTDCNINCGQTSGSNVERNKACLGSCGSVYDNCTDQAVAVRKACYGIGQKGNQSQQSYVIEIKNFLDQLESVQTAIDQCPPPRIPSESDCVAAKLPSLDMPMYIKDASWDPKYADSVILDDTPGVQIVSFSKDTIVPKSVDAKKNGDPSNFILTPEIHIAKKTARPQFILSTTEAETSSVKYEYTLADDNGSYSGFTMPGKVWSSPKNLVELDKDPFLDTVKVGGPAVTNVTKMVLASDAKVTLANRPGKSVMEVSNGARIVVAGWAADDTLEAAKEFISQLKNVDDE